MRRMRRNWIDVADSEGKNSNDWINAKNKTWKGIKKVSGIGFEIWREATNCKEDQKMSEGENNEGKVIWNAMKL